MIIPAVIRFLGRTWRIVWDKEMCHRLDFVGQIWYRTQEIHLQPSIEGQPRPREAVEVCFMHELQHMVDNAMGREGRTEADVDMEAQLWYHVLKDNGMLKEEDNYGSSA